MPPIFPPCPKPTPGQIVPCRLRTWLAQDVHVFKAGRHRHRVSLLCLDDDAQGQPLDVFWELELGCRIMDKEAWVPPKQGIRCPSPVQCIPAHPAVELYHRHRSQSFPISIQSRHSHRCLAHLLKLNAERAAAEAITNGALAKAKPRPKPAKNVAKKATTRTSKITEKSRKAVSPKVQGELF